MGNEFVKFPDEYGINENEKDYYEEVYEIVEKRRQ